MSRPLRIEFPDAVYHVTSRGDRREAIFESDGDRHLLLALLAQGVKRCETRVLYKWPDGHLLRPPVTAALD